MSSHVVLHGTLHIDNLNNQALPDSLKRVQLVSAMWLPLPIFTETIETTGSHLSSGPIPVLWT